MIPVLTTWDIEIGARTIWAEARGAPPADDLPVCFSQINRLRSGRWYAGSCLAETCLLAYQYSSWNTADPNRRHLAALAFDDPALVGYREMVVKAYNGDLKDPTNGATHYYAETIERPKWVAGATFRGKFGHHLFYGNVP